MTYLQRPWLEDMQLNKMYDQLITALLLHGKEMHEAARTLSSSNSSLSSSITNQLGIDNIYFYAELFDEATVFFGLRRQMIKLYRELAHSKLPKQHQQIIQALRQLAQRYQSFHHDLLENLRAISLFEINSVLFGISSDYAMNRFINHESIGYLSHMKQNLREWCYFIDGVNNKEDEESISSNHGDDELGPEVEKVLLDFVDDEGGKTEPAESGSPAVKGSTDLQEETTSAAVKTEEDLLSMLKKPQVPFHRSKTFSSKSKQLPLTASTSAIEPIGVVPTSVRRRTRGVRSKSVNFVTPSNSSAAKGRSYFSNLLKRRSTKIDTGNFSILNDHYRDNSHDDQEDEEEVADALQLQVFQWSRSFYYSLFSKYTILFHQVRIVHRTLLNECIKSL